MIVLIEETGRPPVPPEALGVLTTARLRLEPIETRHAEVFFGGLQDSDLYEFIDDIAPVTVEALRERYRMLARRQSPDGSEWWLNWAVASRVDGRYLGYVQATIPRDRPALIAYVFFRAAWGKGYATEAVAHLVGYLHRTWGCAEVAARVDAGNARSIALLGRLGFELVTEGPEAGSVAPGEAEYQFRWTGMGGIDT
ncbi:MAG TPA: GNAT family N-acetyltransferase [Longimicrobium sp.]